MTQTGPIDDDRLVRLRHGSAPERAELAALAAADSGVRARLAEWDRQDAALGILYGPVGDEPVPWRHRALLERPARRWRPLLRVAAMAGLVAVGAAGGWTAAQLQRPAAAGDGFAAEALRSHATFVVETAHPVEVPASDEAHLVRWLSNRLGHRITPPDLQAQGFQLIGGRIVPGASGAAAMLMYEDDIGRRLTVFVARAPDAAETAFRSAGTGATRGFWWIEGGLGCAVIGDLPPETLRAISITAYHDLIGI